MLCPFCTNEMWRGTLIRDNDIEDVCHVCHDCDYLYYQDLHILKHVAYTESEFIRYLNLKAFW
jgi:hypothetical protein